MAMRDGRPRGDHLCVHVAEELPHTELCSGRFWDQTRTARQAETAPGRPGGDTEARREGAGPKSAWSPAPGSGFSPTLRPGPVAQTCLLLSQRHFRTLANRGARHRKGAAGVTGSALKGGGQRRAAEGHGGGLEGTGAGGGRGGGLCGPAPAGLRGEARRPGPAALQRREAGPAPVPPAGSPECLGPSPNSTFQTPVSFRARETVCLAGRPEPQRCAFRDGGEEWNCTGASFMRGPLRVLMVDCSPGPERPQEGLREKRSAPSPEAAAPEVDSSKLPPVVRDIYEKAKFDIISNILSNF
ncbi:collagen alpha-1(I) chain-like [Pipistrellus kuhlii]|uniref:collagen alpha-1(I) chain-like n=1 Tax=Pipistrellus kuhlii TaxID=59472 RepID=UPI001E271F9A|nr:collagen alpha-1(I) chain-like [Pipistrellus kuhlii]